MSMASADTISYLQAWALPLNKTALTASMVATRATCSTTTRCWARITCVPYRSVATNINTCNGALTISCHTTCGAQSCRIW